MFDTSRITSGEKCAMKGKRMKPSLSEETIPNFHNISANILNEPAVHNKVRVRRWQQNGNFTSVERRRSWMPPLAQSDARSLHEHCAQLKTSGFPVCLYLCSHDYVCPQLSYAGCPQKKVIFGEDVLLPLFQYLNWISHFFTVKFHHEVCLLFPRIQCRKRTSGNHGTFH